MFPSVLKCDRTLIVFIAAGNAKVVMIGEMTHGSKEFYQFRSLLSI